MVAGKGPQSNSRQAMQGCLLLYFFHLTKERLYKSRVIPNFQSRDFKCHLAHFKTLSTLRKNAAQQKIQIRYMESLVVAHFLLLFLYCCSFAYCHYLYARSDPYR